MEISPILIQIYFEELPWHFIEAKVLRLNVLRDTVKTGYFLRHHVIKIGYYQEGVLP